MGGADEAFSPGDEDIRRPPSVSLASARWLWPALGLLTVAALGLVGVVIDEVAVGGAFRFDDALLIALRQPGRLDRPIDPA